MKMLPLLLISGLAVIGCAKVQVQAPKEPIKVDISMRLDVYQHVEKDIDEIESIVSGGSEKPQSKAIDSLLNFFVKDAYALEGLSPEVKESAIRRRDRHDALEAFQARGVIGENAKGFVEIRIADSAAEALVTAENRDRLIIFEGVAKKNGTSVEDVRAIYAKNLQEDAPTGTPVQSADGSWAIK